MKSPKCLRDATTMECSQLLSNNSTKCRGAALERSDVCINIPMFGIIESLNLGTSSGIVLYEITKQRRVFQFNLKKKIAGKKLQKT
jgi:tRNA G18 (ribose-2'-O)-methylase SpoU